MINTSRFAYTRIFIIYSGVDYIQNNINIPIVYKLHKKNEHCRNFAFINRFFIRYAQTHLNNKFIKICNAITCSLEIHCGKHNIFYI